MRIKNTKRSDALFSRADKQWDKGRLLSAFRLFLSSAKKGDDASMLNLGYYYDVGIGVHKNESKAIYWYMKAYHRGNGSAAKNIGIIWRDRKCYKRSLKWFQKAIILGEIESNYEIAKYYYGNKLYKEAIIHLKTLLKSTSACEYIEDEAKKLFELCKRRNAERS
jgi:uncharacterized protein